MFIKQSEQEPVGKFAKFTDGIWREVTDGSPGVLLYTAPPEPEPMAWVDFQKEAQQIVESKALWKKFIDNTPLANDISCWMTDFALKNTAPPRREWVGLTDDEKQAAYLKIDAWNNCVNWIETTLREKNK
jgi:hypothetical protein